MGADLKVIRMKNWQREMYYDETSLIWVSPSPNMPTLNTALVYPGTCLVEGTNISEGRGTVKPFEMMGAPWIEGIKLCQRLNSKKLPGVIFRLVYFSPLMSKYKDKKCQGVQFHIIDREAFLPVLSGLMEEGAKEIVKRGITSKDVVVGIAASKRTPYVIGALKKARGIGAGNHLCDLQSPFPGEY